MHGWEQEEGRVQAIASRVSFAILEIFYLY
jgi:hypothetical protein